MFIIFKKETFGNSKGDRVYVQHDEGDYYYYDSFRRWCCVERDKEGEVYEIEGDRLGKKWKCRP